jgi:thioredoxin 1
MTFALETAGPDYLAPDQAPTRAEVDAFPGRVLLEFGTHWCPICQAIQPRVAELMQARPDVRRIKIEDGPGLPLGRSFKVKFWPYFVFLKDGVAVRELVRPSVEQLKEAFQAF